MIRAPWSRSLFALALIPHSELPCRAQVAAAVAQMSVSSVEEAEKAKEEGAILQEQLSGAGANHAALVRLKPGSGL
jgi:hypothetical protein